MILSFYLNSEDVHEMTHSRAKGGTMVIWHSSLSVTHIRSAPHLVTQLCVSSALPVSPPNILPSVHTGVYLPTAGRDGEWLNVLVELELHIIETRMKYKNIASFLRGDFNASSKNRSRATILSAFIARLGLTRVAINHNTYHHFTGGGDSDSDLDIILYSDDVNVSKYMNEVSCELEHHLISSHHDLIVIKSTFTLPPIKMEYQYYRSESSKP